MTLSDKIVIMNMYPVIHGIDPEDVKAFIEELKEEIPEHMQDNIKYQVGVIIDKLAGKELTCH